MLVASMFLVGPAAARVEPAILSWDSDAAVLIARGPAPKATATLRNDTGIAVVATASIGPAATVEPRRITLAPGAAAVLTIRPAGGPLKPGSTTLTVVAAPNRAFPTGAVVRREVTIGRTTPVPAVSSVQAVSRWGLPWGTDGGLVPLSKPQTCASIGAPPSPAGFLRSDRGDVATIGASCAVVDSRAVLRLTFDGLARTGATYTGDLKLGDKTVAVTVRRTAGLVLPVALLLLGLVLALWLLNRAPARVVATLRQQLRLLQARVGTREAPGQAIRDFRTAAKSSRWGRLDVFDNFVSTAKSIDEDITALGTAKRFSLTESSPEAAALRSRIAAVESAIKDLGPLAKQLTAVEQGIAVVAATLTLQEWVKKVTATLLMAQPVTVHRIPLLLKDATEAADICRRWGSIAQQTAALQSRLKELLDNDSELSPAERLAVGIADGKMRAALAAFGRAETSTEVNSVLAGEFSDARRAVDALSGLRKATPRSGVAGPAGAGGAGLIGRDLGSAADYQREADQIVADEKAASGRAVGLVIALLICAGLQALVIGKPFGTWWDLIQAVAWGAGSTAVAAPLASALEGLGSLRVARRSR